MLYAGRSEPGRLAAVELARYLSRLAGCRVSVLTPARGPGEVPVAPAERLIELVETPSGPADGGRPDPDAFRWTVSASGVRVEAAGPRGLLYAVYDLLEELGCRWYYPGPVGERIPRMDEVRLSLGVRTGEPALAGRSLILGHDIYLGDIQGWTEWTARNRLTGLFLHEFPPPVLGGRPARFWREALVRAAPGARRRGLTLEFGGHGLSGLVPRRLFSSRPELFRYDGARRTPDHNFCPTGPAGLELVRRNARAWFDAHPGPDVYHLWPDDVVDEGWCRCLRCWGFSPSDQALLAVNAAAEALEEVHPEAVLTFLAYHDTRRPPGRVRPRPNVVLLYAPRERCYAHALADPSCEVNRAYHRDLLENVGVFGREPRVFEYYLDAVLFKSMLPPLGRVMAKDLAAYRAAGIRTVGALMTSDRPWVTVPLNPWLFARLAWDPEADLGQLIEDFAAGVFGDAGLGRYYECLEEAFGALLELDGQDVRLRMPAPPLIERPPLDVLDFLGSTTEGATRKLAGIRLARALLDEAAYLLGAAGRRPRAAPGMRREGPPAVPGERLEPPAARWRPQEPSAAAARAQALADEAADLELSRLQLAFFEARQEVYQALRTEVASGTRAALQRGWTTLRRIGDWGRVNLTGWLARAQSTFFRGMWGLQLLSAERILEDRSRGRRPSASPSPVAGPHIILRLREAFFLVRMAAWWGLLRLLGRVRRPETRHHRIA